MRLLNSIFTKLLLVLLVTGICINLTVTGYLRNRFQQEEGPFRKGIIHHLTYIVRDLGDPPDPIAAEKVSQESSIQIQFEDPGVKWSTSGFLSLPAGIDLRPSQAFPNVRTGKDRGCHVFVIDQGAGRFTFELSRGFSGNILDMGAVARLIVFLTVILAGAFFSIRAILGPVRGLAEGVKEVAEGNLDYRVRFKRMDELGLLAKAFNDMTDRIRNMLKAKEQLMLDVSHELRSPLTRMKVAVESLSDGRSKKSIREDVIEMEGLVTRVLETARSHYTYGQLKKRRVDIVGLLKETLGAFAARPPGIRAGKMPDKVEIEADPDRVKSVFKNVLDNAIKYSLDADEPVEVSVENRKPYVVVRVEDHGVGIPVEELRYIFEPFYRVDKSRSKETGGYGLGLSLCKTIMEAHRGKLELDSSPEGGTTVSLLFPSDD